MSDYGASVVINRDAQEVFDFVKDPRQMPRYLPTMLRAEPKGEGKIEVVGETFQGQGWFEVDETHMMMRWGSNGERLYAGHFTVTPMDERCCKAEVQLLFQDEPGDHERDIQQSLDQTMNAIKNICEGYETSDLAAARRRGYMS